MGKDLFFKVTDMETPIAKGLSKSKFAGGWRYYLRMGIPFATQEFIIEYQRYRVRDNHLPEKERQKKTSILISIA